jgi:4-amino-4-deoxy-L-arabinose transferase-like glycosyltransferase
MPDASPRFSLPTPLQGWALVALLAIYLLVGTTGHLPWRGDDLTHLGPIHSILNHGTWLLPEIAGEIYRENPPLYYWLGAGLAWLFGNTLPVHDAARLASSVFTAATLYWTGLAARRMYGPNSFAPAILLGLGALGLVVHAHETQPILAQLAGMALCYAGLAEQREHPWRAALQTGIGSAVAFLAGGLSGLVLTSPLVALSPVLCPSHRCRTGLLGTLLSLAITATIAGLWLGAVALNHPGEIPLWWRDEYASIRPHLSNLAAFNKLIQLLGWFSWPLWPIAGWAVWRNRQQLLLGTPQLTLPILASLLAILFTAFTGSIRPANMLPILPPLCLLATFGVESLRRGAANAFDWFGVTTFIFFGLLVWLGWSALHFSWPPGLARQVARIAPDFPEESIVGGAVIGAILSATLLLLPVLTRRGPLRGTTNWALGLTLLWCLAVTLWQPWFVYTKNYQPVASDLAKTLDGRSYNCVKRAGLGDTQRAALDYFSGIRTVRYRSQEQCNLLLTYSTASSSPSVSKDEWTPIWQRRLGGGRKTEIFRLYQHN